MPDSVRKALKNAIEMALEADGAPATLHRSLTRALASTELPGYVLQFQNEAIAPAEHGAVERRLALQLICLVTPPAADPDSDFVAALDEAIEPLTRWAEEQVALDETFGGLAVSADCSNIAWRYDVQEYEFVGAVMDFTVVYYTVRHQPGILADTLVESE